MLRDPNFPGSNDVFLRAKQLSLNNFIQSQLSATPKHEGSRMVRYAQCPDAACRAVDNPHSNRLLVTDDRSFRCFRCGEHGSIIDAAMLVWAYDTPREAALALLGEGSIPQRREFNLDSSLIKAEQQKESALHQALPLILAITQSYASDPNCLEYLCKEREIPEAVIKEAQTRRLLGFLPPSRELASATLREALGENLLVTAGLWNPDKYPTPWIAGRPLIFFFPGLRAAEFRLARTPKDAEKKSLQRGSTDYPWFWSGKDSSRALVVEGFIDLLSVVALGYSGHVLGVPGCNNWRPEWFDRLRDKGVDRIDIGFDNDLDVPDNPGHKWAEILGQHLREIGMPYGYAMPKRGDMNELRRARMLEKRIKPL